MKPYISGIPNLYLRHLFPKKASRTPIFPLSEERGYFFFSGRYALAAGLMALGIGPGDTLLFPAYNCGVDVDPILYLKIKPQFYNIRKNLIVDIDDLLNKISHEVKAILVTHFLGLPQPVDQIKQICAEKNLLLIEDCAHAFLSQYKGRPLGSYGDASFFSLWKTLPVLEGGLLILNKEDSHWAIPPKAPSIFPTLFHAARLLKLRTWDDDPTIKQAALRTLCNFLFLYARGAQLLVAAFRKFVNPKAMYLVRPDSDFFIEDLITWAVSRFSINIINNTDFERTKSLRRRNFEYLLNHFLENDRGILPFRQLPPEVCPLFFPIIIKSAEHRENLYRILKRKGVTTHPWWNRFHSQVPWDAFPDAVYLKQRLFGLPIHQDLTLRHLDYVIREFEKAYQRDNIV